MQKIPTEIQAARLRLVKKRPYLASAAWALRLVERPGLNTLAVDRWWRLYYDPTIISRWTVEELSGVLYHEIMHLLRDHASRMENFDRYAANIAADAEVNDNLLAEGVCLPKWPGEPVTPARIGQPENLLAEEYYAALEKQAQQPASGQGAPSQAGGDEESGETGNAQPDDPGDGSGSKGKDSDGSESGDGGGSMSPPASDQPSDSSSRSESTSQPPSSPGHGREGGQDGRESGDQAQTPAPGSGRCGSCATGQPEPWEEGPPQDGDGVHQAEAEMIRRDVARQIVEASRSRGNVPGHLARWAEEKLRPKVDWRKELAAAVRHAVADVSGASDYSYARPSRRQGQVGNGKVILPSLRRPVPSVAVVVDTSGSMSDGMLNQALAEVSGILKGLGQRDCVTVLAVDAAVHASKKVFSPRQVQLAGGGGTDMGVGIKAATELRPVPQVCIVITDGETPWPETSPHGMKVIVALVGQGDGPKWAKNIKVEE